MALIILGREGPINLQYRIGPRSTIRSEGGGQKVERGKVRESFFQVGVRKAEADEKRRKNFPLGTPHIN